MRPAVSDLDRVKLAIRCALMEDGVSQADLARYLGVSEKHVCQVLLGRCTGTFQLLERMAHACGLEIRAVPTTNSHSG